MYSVVLMMAMTTSVDAPDCHRHSCCGGCTGAVAVGCSGCTGCGHTRHLLFGGHGHGCHGCSGCSGSSCGGGYVGCSGCSGYTGCTGGAGCAGGVILMPGAPAMAPEKAPEKVKPAPKPVGAVSAPATISVSLPADAKLSIDGVATTSTSSERVFVSPELPAGREFSYTLKAEFQHEGKPVVVSKKVNVRAGIESRVTFSNDLASVASR